MRKSTVRRRDQRPLRRRYGYGTRAQEAPSHEDHTPHRPHRHDRRLHRGDRFSSPGGQASKPSAATSASIAAHREQISNEQWQRSQAQPAAAPLTDRTSPDTGLPIVLVLLGVAVPLGLAFLIGRPILGYARHRHHPTSAA
jgi:hypothetical protein